VSIDLLSNLEKSIELSLLISLMLMKAFGLVNTMMTLGGLVIAIGSIESFSILSAKPFIQLKSLQIQILTR